MDLEKCDSCGGNGFDQQLPRLKPSWKGWKSSPAHDMCLQVMGDTDGMYVMCNDCLVSHAFVHWCVTGIWQYPQNVRV